LVLLAVATDRRVAGLNASAIDLDVSAAIATDNRATGLELPMADRPTGAVQLFKPSVS
jgi:hypothetical protein